MAVVLIVEDEEQVRVLTESFLQGEGHTTLSAGSTEQTLALVENQEQPIDLLFANLTIQNDPEAGLKLAAKATVRRPDLKVLYTSVQAVTDGMRELFVENSTYLQKPYTTEQLGTILLAKFGLGPQSIKVDDHLPLENTGLANPESPH